MGRMHQRLEEWIPSNFTEERNLPLAKWRLKLSAPTVIMTYHHDQRNHALISILLVYLEPVRFL